ncbi:MAG TPA: aspartyl protease family protein [Candidatus Acidoferrales bacterium]
MLHYLLLAALLVAGPVAAPPSAAQQGAAQRAASERARIEVTILEGHIDVPVRVNGRPMHFVLDTGASTTVLRLSHADALGLEKGRSFGAQGAGVGSTLGQILRGVRLEVAGIEHAPPAMPGLPLGSLAPFMGRENDGILGYDFLSRFVVEIRYAESLVILHDPAAFTAPAGARQVPFTLFAGRLPQISARVKMSGREPITAPFVLDTGARPAMVFARPFAERTRLRESLAREVPVLGGGGLGTAASNRVAGRIEWLDFGGFQLKGVPANFPQAQSGFFANQENAGVIGAEVFSRFTLTFDYRRGKLYLQPNAQLPEAFPYDASGLFLISDPPEFISIRVHAVVPGSPAAAAGLREGDAIVRVDSRPATDVGLHSLRELLRRNGEARTLTVQRDGRTFEVRLRLESLL